MTSKGRLLGSEEQQPVTEVVASLQFSKMQLPFNVHLSGLSRLFDEEQFFDYRSKKNHYLCMYVVLHKRQNIRSTRVGRQLIVLEENFASSPFLSRAVSTLVAVTVKLEELPKIMAAVTRHGPIYTRIVQKLTEALRPVSLTLKDESHLHAGHRESPGLPETHFNLEIVSDAFSDMPLVQRQRKVYSILTEEMNDRVHALSMKTKTSSEAGLSGANAQN